MKRISLALIGLAALLIPGQSIAQQPIKVGYPMILSGPGALFGEPALKGAQMFVEEINAKGGVLGRKIELVSRDTKGNADEAVRVSRELILKDNVDFLVGTLTSAEGPAVSTIAKENKIVFIAPIPKTDQLTAPANLHPYVFRTASNTTIEGRTAAEIMAKWPVKKIATIAPDYAYGQDVAKAFIEHIKKIKPDVEIVDQQWPKLGEAGLHALHQRPDGQEARGCLLGALGRALPDLCQAGQAAQVFRQRQLQLHRRRRGCIDRIRPAAWAPTTRSASGATPTMPSIGKGPARAQGLHCPCCGLHRSRIRRRPGP